MGRQVVRRTRPGSDAAWPDDGARGSRVAGGRPHGATPRTGGPSSPSSRRTLGRSARELQVALLGRPVSAARPSWLPGFVPSPTARMVATAVHRQEAVLAWWKKTRLGRALARFNVSRGALLCGGLAYTALFALFAALAIGYTIFMAVLGGNEQLRNDLLDEINTAVPGLIDVGDGSGGAIKPDDLLLSASSVAGVVAALVLLWTATSFMSALRGAVRIMLGLALEPVNFVVGKAKDLSAFVVLLVAIVASSAVSVVATSASSWLVRTLGLPESVSGLVAALGFAVAGVIDVLVVVYVLRVLGGSRAGWGDTLRGSVVAAVLLGGLRYLGTSVIVGSASRNALLGSFAAIVTVLLLVNFVARVLLLVAAWLSDPAPDDVYPRRAARLAGPADVARLASAGDASGTPGTVRYVAGARPRESRVRSGLSPAQEAGTTTSGRPPQEDGRSSWWSRLVGRLRPGRLRRRG
ncbi:YihY/virulence factor BrkB family protein [Luteimicrobium sp. NPDC057192]|uniref:YihY/virulence factor BrkB family protein n=1 Tax=Luteimicrobium sp. NPDC057192 TaxID=3346042 RepID=UPI003628F059